MCFSFHTSLAWRTILNTNSYSDIHTLTGKSTFSQPSPQVKFKVVRIVFQLKLKVTTYASRKACNTQFKPKFKTKQTACETISLRKKTCKTKSRKTDKWVQAQVSEQACFRIKQRRNPMVKTLMLNERQTSFVLHIILSTQLISPKASCLHPGQIPLHLQSWC